MPLTITFDVAGSYTIDDDGILGNNISVVRNASGAIIHTFGHPDFDSVHFVTTTPGVNLTFNVADPFTLSPVFVGSLSDPAANPDSIVIRQITTYEALTLVSNGTITEGGSDAAADIAAASVVLSAANGIGTPGNALETRTGYIEAETNTGGINLANFGDVAIGGLTADVAGLDVVTSGNINFSATGLVYLTDTTGASMIHGGDLSGNVTLNAIGPGGDIVGFADRPAISAAGGGITLNAGRDVQLGTAATEYDNDLLASGGIAINATRDFLLDGRSNVRTGAFTGAVGGDIVITTGRNINLSNATGGLQTIDAFQGDVVLTTGSGAGFFESATIPAAIRSTDDITVNADTVAINNGGLNTTGAGSVTIRPVTPGRPIYLGLPSDPYGALSLSDAEFDRLYTLNVNIGSAVAGTVDFTDPLSPFLAHNLSVQSGTDILFRSSLTLSGSLTLRAGDDLHFIPTSSFTSTSGSLFAFVDNAQDDDGIGGFGTLAGTLTGTFSIELYGDPDADTLNGSSDGDLLGGRAGNDILRGYGGADVLAGGSGIDTMLGGLGDDTYIVEETGDIVTEAVGEGFDVLYTTVSYGLAAGSSIEGFAPYDRLATYTMNLFGNDQGQIIHGNNGMNQLIGGGGTDAFYGHAGNDSYLVDDLTDQVFEAAGEGNDTVYATGSHALVAGQSIETLSVFDRTTTNAINLSGNGFGQTIYGNNGVNALIGGGGTDTFFGMGGDDGIIVDDMTDVVFEFAGGGTDSVYTTAHYALGAGSAVETLTVYDRTTTNAINLAGNELGQTIYGNNGANFIDGKGGADTIYLLGGADTARFTTPLGGGNVDALVGFASGTDKIQLDSVIFTGLAPGPLPAGVLVIGGLPADANDRLLYNQVTGQLFFDPDGNGAAAAILFATLGPGTVLATNDFAVL